MSNSSFLPEDYLAQRTERRTNIICLILFGVVMIGIFGAFLVTNRQWTQVKQQRQTISAHYQEAAQQIQDLNDLEEQKEAMLDRAELATALVERVPRSILLAELINRMPPRLSLLEFELTSEKLKAPAAPKAKAQKTGNLRGNPARAQTREEAAEAVTKVEAPHYRVEVQLVGVAPTDTEVARYMAALNAYRLVHDVRLAYSEDKEVEGREMRQFCIEMLLDVNADVRNVEPLIPPHGLGNPMSDEMVLTPPESHRTASVPTDEREGD